MNLDQFLEISILFEFYKDLLSTKQRHYLTRHFEEDFSLSEIAEENGITRQAVYDNVRRGINLLYEYEDKLRLYKKSREKKELYDKLINLRENFDRQLLDKIIDESF